MRLETPLIVLLVSGLIFTSLYTVFISDLGVKYGAEMNLSVFDTKNGDASISESFDKINQTKAKMDKLNEDYAREQVTDSGSVFGFLKLTKTIGDQMLGSVNILKELLYAFAGLLGVPPIFVTTAITIIMVLLILTIVMILAGVNY